MGRFTCDACQLTLALGIIAYRVEKGNASIASDQVPTPREALAMRELAASVLAERQARRKGAEERLNVVVEAEEKD